MSEEKIETASLAPALGPRDIAAVCLYSVLLFLAMTVQTGRMSVILPFLAMVLTIGREPLRRIRERLSVPLLGFLLFALMYGFAAVYASQGAYAVAEYNKFIASFSLAVIFLARFDRKHVRGLLWGLAGVLALIGLICVDMGCSAKLFGAFNGGMQLLGMDFTETLEASQGARLNGIYNDANITGVMMGVAVFVCVYLLRTSKKLWEKALGSVLLGICSVAFLTAVSRGAILCFALAALIYLAAEREDRLGLFFTLCATAVGMVLCSAVALLHMEEGSFLPDVMCVLCGAAIFLLEQGVNTRLVGVLRGHGKAVVAGCGVLVLVLCGVVVLALTWTVPHPFSEGGITRGMAPVPGEHTIEGDWDEGVKVDVYYRTWVQAIRADANIGLYNGPVDGASFVVPEDAFRLYVSFSGEAGKEIRSASFSDGTKIPLKYRLLPGMISSRLQDGLFYGSSYLLRAQYDIDGWKLFQRSPLIGFGLGSSETWLTSLQPCFYESLYLHNHILQVLCDMGVIGLVFWLAFLGGSLWLLIRQILRAKDPLASVLLGCWSLMVIHGLMEINFSIRAFQCMAWLLLLLPVVLYTKPLSSERLVQMGGFFAALFMWMYLLVFGGLLECRRMAAREMEGFSTDSVATFMEQTRKWVKMDVFDHEQEQLNFVGNAVLLDDGRYTQDMELYAGQLRASGTYTACSGLAEYYYLPQGEYEEMFACSREGVFQEASVADAWNQQFDFYRMEVLAKMTADDMEVFMDGVLALRADLESFSEGRYEEIRLTEANQAFVDQVASAREQGLTGAAALLFITVFGSAQIAG